MSRDNQKNSGTELTRESLIELRRAALQTVRTCDRALGWETEINRRDASSNTGRRNSSGGGNGRPNGPGM